MYKNVLYFFALILAVNSATVSLFFTNNDSYVSEISVIAFSTVLLFLISDNKNFSFTKGDWIVVYWLLFSLICAFKNNFEMFFGYLILSILYFSLRSSKYKLLSESGYYIFFLLPILSWVVLYILDGSLLIDYNKVGIISFRNPSPASLWLGLGIIIGVSVLSKKKTLFNFDKDLGLNLCFIFVTLVSLFIIFVIAKSRTTVLRLTFIILLFVSFSFFSSLSRKQIAFTIFFSAIFISALAFVLINLKFDSFIGRFLIWKNLFLNFDLDYVWNGVLETPIEFLRNSQMNFFKNNIDIGYKKALILNEVSFYFNDYVFLLINFGVLGLVLYLVVWGNLIFKSFNQNQTSLIILVYCFLSSFMVYRLQLIQFQLFEVFFAASMINQEVNAVNERSS